MEKQPDYQSSNINVLTRKGAQTEKNLADLREKSLKIPEELRSSEEPTDEKIKQAENAITENQLTTQNLEKNFSENVLRKGYAHDVPVAEKVTAHIEGVKNPATGRREGGVKQEIGKTYDKIENDLKDKNIAIPQTKHLEDAQSSALKLLENSRHAFKNDEEYDQAIEAARGSEKSKNPMDIVPAADILSNYRTMRHLGQKLRQQAFSTKVASNKDLQADLLKQADEFETNAKTLESALESHDLGGSVDLLKQTNKRWRTEVTPLYQNKTYRQFLKGTGPDNIIKSLRGNGPGQEIIRNIIKNDPDLLRNVVGQRYAQNPEKLHEFDELTHEYTQHMPEVEQFKNVHNMAKQNEARSKTALNKIQEEHKVRSEGYEIQQEIKSHEDKNDKIKNDIKLLRNKEQKTKLSLKQKLDLEHQIKNKQNEIKETNDKINKLKMKYGKLKSSLKWGAGLTTAAVIGTPLSYKIKSLISGS